MDDPLSDEELLELDEFLNSDAVSEDAMPTTMLHGFLAAVVSGPALVMPSEWLGVVFGSSEGTFADIERARRIYGLIMRFYNETNFVLTQIPELFVPVLPFAVEHKKSPAYAGFWSRGYVEGMQLRLDDWKPYFDEPAVANHLRAIVELTEDLPGGRLPRGVRRREVAATIAASAAAVHGWFLKQRRRASSVRRASPKIGRNDPCPCGSGRKYKSCCGAA